MLQLFFPFFSNTKDVEDPIVIGPTFWPTLSFVLAMAALCLSGLLLSNVLIVGAALLLWGSIINISRTHQTAFRHASSRRLAFALFPASLAFFVPTLIAAHAPDVCAELAPELFILSFPFMVFCLVAGAKISASLSKTENWTAVRMPKEGLFALAAASLTLLFLNTGSLTCTPTGQTLFFQFGFATFAGIALSGLFEKKRSTIFTPNKDTQ